MRDSDTKKRTPGTVPTVFLLMPVVVGARAFALSVAWGWFIVPMGAPALGIFQAAGIWFFATWFMPEPKTIATSPESAIERAFSVILGTAITLAFAGVAYLCMGVL